MTTSTTYRSPEQALNPPGMPSPNAQQAAQDSAGDANDTRLMPLHQPEPNPPWWAFLCWKRYVKKT